jgi:hypothetical protein
MVFTPTTIAKATYSDNIWKNFFDLIKDQVTSLYINASIGTSTIKVYTTSFSDNEFDEKTDYPVIVIETPSVSTEQLTMGKTKVSGTMDIEIYASAKETSSKFFDKINNTIETYKHTLRQQGLRFIELDSSDYQHYQRGKIKIHMKKSRFAFEYVYSRTGTY